MLIAMFIRWVLSQAKKDGVDAAISKYDGLFHNDLTILSMLSTRFVCHH